jgi:ABC-2 type transport system ATP-binding protein
MVDSSDGMAIELDHVAKTYRRKVHALRGIEMRVRRGEIFGLLGPNGAGKSTLVKIMMTVVRPSRADGKILGQPIGHKPTLAKVGYLPENPRFPAYLSGRQALEFYAALSKVDRRSRRRRAMELLEQVGLKDWAKAKIGTYSKGMQQRLGLAQALASEPELIVLDEPTDGLDPMGRRETRQLLKRLRDQGTTVFLNSHLLGEVEQVCDRVAILVAGRVMRQGTVDDLTARTRYYEIQLHGEPTPSTLDTVSAALPSGETVELAGGTIRIGISDVEALQPVIDALRSHKLVIESVRPVQESLEDFFVAAVSGSEGGDSAGPSTVKGGRS